ncbi:MAG TPA: glycosyltransferase [Candidatus Angelobacter sp.]
MLILAAALSLLIWIYLAAAHGRFWQIKRFTPTPTTATGQAKSIAVIVPARNEAEFVGQCISSLLLQEGGHRIRVFLVDDGSSDGTADVACQTAEAEGKPELLTVLPGKPLAAGWSGKLWAVEQGVESARELNPDFLLLTDADIEHGPRSLATLITVAESGGFDVASFMVKLYCRSLGERALIPAFVYFFFQLYPPAWISSPWRSTAGAAGGSILIRPAALERAGGIAAVRNEIIDDCALARAVKRSGGKVWLGTTQETKSIRPYGNWKEVGRMISRSAFNQLQHSTWLLLLALAGMTITYLLPPALTLLGGRSLPALLGAAAWATMAWTFLPIVRFYRLSPLWSLALPLIAIFYMGTTFHSAFKFWTGKGGEWKGRVQDPSGVG